MSRNDSQLTSKLLTAGFLGGPFFIALSLLQAFTREGFNWIRHPASLLSLGDLGFIQIANFVITGTLFIACAVGLKRILSAGVGRKWISPLFALVGIAFILGGVFVADPAFGFPPGTPEGMPKTMSWHSIIHGLRASNRFFGNLRRAFNLRTTVVEAGSTRCKHCVSSGGDSFFCA